jgi:hypothetical protein
MWLQQAIFKRMSVRIAADCSIVAITKIFTAEGLHLNIKDAHKKIAEFMLKTGADPASNHVAIELVSLFLGTLKRSIYCEVYELDKQDLTSTILGFGPICRNAHMILFTGAACGRGHYIAVERELYVQRKDIMSVHGPQFGRKIELQNPEQTFKKYGLAPPLYASFDPGYIGFDLETNRPDFKFMLRPFVSAHLLFRISQVNDASQAYFMVPSNLNNHLTDFMTEHETKVNAAINALFVIPPDVATAPQPVQPVQPVQQVIKPNVAVKQVAPIVPVVQKISSNIATKVQTANVVQQQAKVQTVNPVITSSTATSTAASTASSHFSSFMSTNFSTPSKVSSSMTPTLKTASTVPTAPSKVSSSVTQTLKTTPVSTSVPSTTTPPVEEMPLYMRRKLGLYQPTPVKPKKY